MREKPAGWIRLNLRALRLVLAGKWLTDEDVGKSYDNVAASYDDSWLRHLRTVTDDFLSHLPQPLPGKMIDLGCGTGYATRFLAEKFAGHELVAADISEKMLGLAKKRLESKSDATFERREMRRYLANQPSRSASLIISAWAIGYSEPKKVIGEAARVLVPGGVFGFVVNCADTLHPIFHAFRRCMVRFPEKLELAAFPRFPKHLVGLAKTLERHHFTVLWSDEGQKEIPLPKRPETGMLGPLLQTGVLAGFDVMLPLHENGPVSEYFETLLRENRDPIKHHYVMMIARRK